MIKHEAECLFSTEIIGDTILQLKSGRLLFYSLRSEYKMEIYNEKTFQKILSIDLIIGDLYEEDENKNKNSIKELNNGAIIIGRDNYLVELILKDNTYKFDKITKLNDIILDVNELPDQTIIAITNQNIILLNIENGKFIIKNKYLIKDNWKISNKHSEDFNQYFSSELLPNNRLLLNSFSLELCEGGMCYFGRSYEFSRSKIIFMNISNFEEIKTKELITDNKYIKLENIIIVQSYINLYIYDINSLELIKTLKLKRENHYIYMYKYDIQYLITISIDEADNWIDIYKKQNNDVIKHGSIKTNIPFKKEHRWNNEPIKKFNNNKNLLTLKDKRVVIICHNNIYVLKLNLL